MTRQGEWMAVYADEFPQQQMALVVDLPPLPPELEVGTFGNGLSPDETPRRLPRGARHLATLEWGWTINAFYLSTNRRRSHWILWTSYLDDNWCPFRWVRVVLAHAPRRGVPLETAAVHLLLAGIRAAPELIYAPFRIEVEGLLTVPDLVAMKRLLWPD